MSPSTELLAPAGDLQAAVSAFHAGADAVYLGLHLFSARKSATNFSISDLRRLKTLATRLSRRIYITINTLILDDEFDDLAKLLTDLEWIGVDAIIVQDIGVARFIRAFTPSIPLHASTQMALHTPDGLRLAHSLGISRVVLPRETNLASMKALHAAIPTMELEAFIHGALCYSFSGLCLASGLLLGRSGNRGECAQICRNFFNQGPKMSYPFSCNDLTTGLDILELRKAGITSFKIEGRMKSKDYVHHVVRYYRRILDTNGTLSPKEREALHESIALTFSRKTTSGYLHHPHGDDLLSPDYSGHRGLALGKIEAVDGTFFKLTPAHAIQTNDSILILSKQFHAGRHRFNAFKVFDDKRRPKPMARAGEVTWLQAELPVCIGMSVYLIESATQSDIPGTDEKQLPLAKESLPARIAIAHNTLTIHYSLKGHPLSQSFPISVQSSENAAALQRSLHERFHESGDSRWILDPIALQNETSYPALFIRPSDIKRIRNDFFQNLNTDWERVSLLSPRPAPTPRPTSQLNEQWISLVQKRQLLSPLHSPIPFAREGDLQLERLASHDLGGQAWVFVPLFPIIENEDSFKARLHELVVAYPHHQFAIGLNNLAHRAWAQSLRDYSHVHFFLDVFSYVANSFTLESTLENISLLFAYQWIEAPDAIRPISACPLIKISDPDTLPYFISLGCFQKNSFKSDRCATCPRSFTHDYENGKNRFRVIVSDCITLLFKNPKP